LVARLLLSASVLAPFARNVDAAKGEFFVYIGTYTQPGKSQGIYVFQFDAASGKLTPQGLAAEAVNPSFLSVHPSGKYLYAVNEVDAVGGQKSGGVTSFSVDRATGKLTAMNTVSSRGTGPCFVRADVTGKMVLVANYGSGSVAALPILGDGHLGEAVGFDQHKGSSVDRIRQAGPHAHSANFSPDNHYAIVADLGLDKVFVYHLDVSKAKLTLNDPPAFETTTGAGPRHFAFHPNGKYGYVINELQSTVTALKWDSAHGVLKELGTVSTLPAEFRGENTTAEVQVHPSGKFLYGSNRGDDSIAEFAIDPEGYLKLVGHTPTHGKVPRNFAIDPTGTWLIAANQDSDNLAVFRIDPKNGQLTFVSQETAPGSPVCVKFLGAKP
jgi:6-phosphogluconolactonase